MEIQALGYVGIGASDLTDWTDFATNWLGMQAVDRGAGVRAFRMDDRKQRLVVDRALPEVPLLDSLLHLIHLPESLHFVRAAGKCQSLLELPSVNVNVSCVVREDLVERIEKKSRFYLGD